MSGFAPCSHPVRDEQIVFFKASFISVSRTRGIDRPLVVLPKVLFDVCPRFVGQKAWFVPTYAYVRENRMSRSEKR